MQEFINWFPVIFIQFHGVKKSENGTQEFETNLGLVIPIPRRDELADALKSGLVMVNCTGEDEIG